LDMWTLMIDAENVKKMLFEKIKVEAMRTYLFTYSHHYDTIASSNLSAMFALEERFVHGIVSKMITNEELYAAWDQPTNTFKVYRSEPSKLQQLALQVSETAGTFVEWNEKMFEAKSQGGSMISMAKDSEQKKKKTIRSVSTKQTGSKQKSERTKKSSGSAAPEKPRKATIKAH
jgi:translation initiation factor 3 subunit C